MRVWRSDCSGDGGGSRRFLWCLGSPIERGKSVIRIFRIVGIAAIAGALLLNTRASGVSGGYVETDLVVNQEVGNVPTLTDKNGIVHVAKFFDPNLVNPWGVSEGPQSPFWVSDNGNGTASLYNTAGQPQTLVVAIPTPADPQGASGTPTGQAFNAAFLQGMFPVKGVNGGGSATTAGAIFLFATEDGTIAGWNPGVNPPGFDPLTLGKHAIIAVDNSANPDACHGAVY